MTAQTRATLKSAFENGDTPTESDYVDLIDSFVNLSDSTAQTVTSPVTFTGTTGFTHVSANSVSASAGRFVTVSATRIAVAGTAAVNTLKVGFATSSAPRFRIKDVGGGMVAEYTCGIEATASLGGADVKGALTIEIISTAGTTTAAKIPFWY